MLKKIIEKRNYFIFLIIIVLIIFIIFSNANKVREYIKTFNYFDETLTFKLYTNKEPQKIFKNINNIYKKYEDYYEQASNRNEKDLIEILKYGKELYKESNGLIDITSYELLEKIKNDEKFDFKTTIDSLDFKNNQTLKNINIEMLIGSYATKKVEDYLKDEKLNQYLISEDGNIIAGKRHGSKKYTVSLNDQNGEAIDFINLENESVASKGNVQTFKPYMVNPITSKKNDENKLVVVIADDINKANFLANTLYLMSVNDGKKFIENYDAKAFWYTNDNQKEMTENFKKYLE